MRAWSRYQARLLAAILGFWIVLVGGVQKVLAQTQVEDLFKRSQDLAQQTSAQFDAIWNDEFSNFMNIPLNITQVIAVFALVWLFLTLMKENSYYGDVDWGKLVLPLIIVFILIKPNLPVETCLAVRNVINKTNNEAIQATRLHVLYAQSQGNQIIRAVVAESRSRCENLSPTERNTCLQAELVNIERAIQVQQDLYGPIDWIQEWWGRFNRLSSQIRLADANAWASDIWLSAAPLWESIIFGILNDIAGSIHTALEVSLMLTSLLLPFALALALSPMELEPIYAWFTAMVSIGLWKIMYTFCAGIGALLLSNDLGSFGNGLGWFIAIFAPLLSLGLVAGGGFAIWQGIVSLGTSLNRSAMRF